SGIEKRSSEENAPVRMHVDGISQIQIGAEVMSQKPSAREAGIDRPVFSIASHGEIEVTAVRRAAGDDVLAVGLDGDRLGPVVAIGAEISRGITGGAERGIHPTGVHDSRPQLARDQSRSSGYQLQLLEHVIFVIENFLQASRFDER